MAAIFSSHLRLVQPWVCRVSRGRFTENKPTAT